MAQKESALMGPGLYQPPSMEMMITAVLIFTTVATVIAMLSWSVIRHRRHRPHRPWMWLVTAVISSLISSYDVSLSTIAQGGHSGIFSIFCFIAIPVYILIVAAVISVAAIWMP